MFSDRLCEVMEKLNLKQSQVAGMTGCSKGAVSQYCCSPFCLTYNYSGCLSQN